MSRRRNAGLSPREWEVLARIAQGQRNPQIAHELGISRKTVERHVENIFGKLKVSSRTEAAIYAVCRGLGDPRNKMGESPDAKASQSG